MKRKVKALAIVCVLFVVSACGKTQNTNGDMNGSLNQNEESSQKKEYKADRSHFEWDFFDENIIVGYSETGMKQETLVIPAECTYVRELYKNDVVEEIVFLGDSTEIAQSCFKECENLKTITLPDNISAIEEYTFYDCPSLNKIIIPDTVVTIETYAFAKCVNLQEVHIGNAVKVIERSAFQDCESLDSIHFPDSLQSIESAAFENCYDMQEIVFGSGLEVIEKYAFHSCNSLKEVVLQEGVVEIGEMAFAYCENLTDIYLPESLSNVDTTAMVQIHMTNIHVYEDSYMNDRVDELEYDEYYVKNYR